MNWYKTSKLYDVSLSGILKQKSDGFVYVDVSNDIIHGMFKLVDEEEIEEPPYFDEDGIGAHISFITAEEAEGLDISEIGEEVSFSFQDIKSTNPLGWDDMEQVWFVALDAPELKEIRKKYKLPATYDARGHDFHITIAVRPK